MCVVLYMISSSTYRGSVVYVSMYFVPSFMLICRFVKSGLKEKGGQIQGRNNIRPSVLKENRRAEQ
jgi:hypothetical protein